jgi:hypothetical protein
MHNDTKPRRPRVSQFKSVQEFWRFHESNPDAFDHMDITGVLEMAAKVTERTSRPAPRTPQNDVPNGNKTPSNNGTKRENNGRNRDAHTSEPPNLQTPEATQNKVGPGNPPKDHQFKLGNPGGPGAPKGPRSMRKIIRTFLFDEDTNEEFALAVTRSLFRQAIKGNTHAIRIICENGNNRHKRV